MKITVSKKDIKDLFNDKYEEAIDDVIVVDDEGNQLISKSESIPEPEPETESTAKVEEEGDGNGIDEYLENEDEGDELELQFNAEELVSNSGISKVLEKGLKDQGYSNKIPSDPVETCEKAADKFIESLKRRDRRLIKEVVSHSKFKRFAILWQDYQNFIHKEIR